MSLISYTTNRYTPGYSCRAIVGCHAISQLVRKAAAARCWNAGGASRTFKLSSRFTLYLRPRIAVKVCAVRPAGFDQRSHSREHTQAVLPEAHSQGSRCRVHTAAATATLRPGSNEQAAKRTLLQAIESSKTLSELQAIVQRHLPKFKSQHVSQAIVQTAQLYLEADDEEAAAAEDSANKIMDKLKAPFRHHMTAMGPNVASCFWAFAVVGTTLSAKTVVLIKQVLVAKNAENLQIADPSQLTGLAVAMGAVDFYEEELCTALVKATLPRVREFSGMHLSDMLFHLAAFQHPCPHLFEATAAYLLDAERGGQLQQLDATTVSNLLWAFSTSGSAKPEVEAAIGGLLRVAVSCVMDMDLQDLVNTAWAAWHVDCAALRTDVDAVCSAVASVITAEVQFYNTAGVVSLLESFANLMYYDEAALAALTQRCVELERELTAMEWEVVMAAVARLGWKDELLMEAGLRSALEAGENVDARQVYGVLWAWTVLGDMSIDVFMTLVGLSLQYELGSSVEYDCQMFAAAITLLDTHQNDPELQQLLKAEDVQEQLRRWQASWNNYYRTAILVVEEQNMHLAETLSAIGIEDPILQRVMDVAPLTPNVAFGLNDRLFGLNCVNYMRNDPNKMMGTHAWVVQRLQAAGYNVIPASLQTWDSLTTAEDRQAYLQDLIRAASSEPSPST